MNRNEDQLAAAREKSKQKGKSPRELGELALRKTIDWIYKWGFTSSGVVLDLLQRTAGGYSQKLSRQGWLIATKTESGIPSHYFTLSQAGLQEAERRSETLCRYPEINCFKVNQKLIRHDLLAQESTINSLNRGAILGFETERMFMKNGDARGIKHPDVVWLLHSGARVGIEIELSSKWDRDLHEFILQIAHALHSSSEKPARFDRFAIISDSSAIIKNYKEAMAPGASLPVWQKNSRGHWAIEKKIAVPDWLISKVDFRLISK